MALEDAENCLPILGGSEMGIETIYLRNLLENMEWANHVIGGRERAKHIDIRKHFAHVAVQNGHMRLYQIPTEYQLADLLTKSPALPIRISKGTSPVCSGMIWMARLGKPKDLGLRRG